MDPKETKRLIGTKNIHKTYLVKPQRFTWLKTPHSTSKKYLKQIGMDEKLCDLHFSMTVLKLISIKRKRSQPEQTDLAVYCIILANVSTCSWQKAGRNCLSERIQLPCLFTKLCQPTDFSEMGPWYPSWPFHGEWNIICERIHMEIIFRESRKYFSHKMMNFKLTSKLILGGKNVMCTLRTVLIPKQNLAAMKTSLPFKALAHIHSFQALF